MNYNDYKIVLINSRLAREYKSLANDCRKLANVSRGTTHSDLVNKAVESTKLSQQCYEAARDKLLEEVCEQS